MLRVVAVGVVLVLAAVAAPDEWRVLAQQGGDLRFAVPVRAADAPDSPVLGRTAVAIGLTTTGYRLPSAGWVPLALYPGFTRFRTQFASSGSYTLRPDPAPSASQRMPVERELVVLVTRLNSAGDGLASSTDTFVVEPSGWASAVWNAPNDAARATRVTAAWGSAAGRSQWYIISVDKTVPGVDIDEAAQRFLYVPPAPPPPDDTPPPPPPAPSRVTGVRVAPLDGGLRVSWSAAAGEVSQYRVDAADASGELLRRVYTDADVFEALVDRLVNGVDYTVTVTALTSHPDVEGPASEPLTAAPSAPDATSPPSAPDASAPSQVVGVRVAPLDGGLRVSWDAAAGDVSQYRVHAEDASGRFHRVHTSADVLEAEVDGLVNGVEYTVTVTALMSDGEDGAPSEPRTATPAALAPSQVAGVRVSPLDGGLRVSWDAAAGEVSQYRVDAVDASGELARRVYTDADVFEALLDRLVNGVEYTVTVTALTGHPDVEGPASEPETETPRSNGGDPVPTPALPLAGAGALAALLVAGAARRRGCPASWNSGGRSFRGSSFLK